MKCCGKTLFSGSSVASQVVAADAPLSFAKNYAVNVDGITSNSVTLRDAGVYLVTVDASGAPTAAGNVSIQPQINGDVLDAYMSTATSTGAADIVHVGFSFMLRVDPTVCCYVDNAANLSIINAAAETTFSNVSITVVRV